MCVIISKPAGTNLYKKRLQRLWDKNSDGAGLSWIDPDTGAIQLFKTLQWKAFWEKYNSVNQEIGDITPMLLHMRIATHGSVSIDNCHPFQVDDNTVVAHNGVISEYAYETNRETLGVQPEVDWSDSRYFVANVLQDMPLGWLDKPPLVDVVEDYIGMGNKLSFLTNSPELRYYTYILNKVRGYEADGMWFSNSYGVNELPTYSSSPNHRGTYHTTRYSSQATTFSPPKSQPSRRGTKEEEDAKLNEALIESGVAILNTAEELELLRTRYDILSLSTPIYQMGEKWFCVMCQEELDNNAYCACWHTVCIECDNYTGCCRCSTGTPQAVVSYEDWKTMKSYLLSPTETKNLEPGSSLQTRHESRKRAGDYTEEEWRYMDVMGTAI